jgi:protein arginine kinase activator
MNCQQCHKPATFHITDLTDGKVISLHLCPDCAKDYLNPPDDDVATPTLANLLTKQLKLGQTAEELAELDNKECPICGITFFEFRQEGRLGCPYDYTHFADELEPLLINVHSDIRHVGKRPKHGAYDAESQNELIRLRREMKESVETENYERASQLRDKIRQIEDKGSS